jgi:colicin import membrane protein
MPLVEWARTGLREMPSNAAWLLDQVRAPTGPGEDGYSYRVSHASRLSSLGDSIRSGLEQAQGAAQEAREAEERALQAAEEAKELSDYALHVSRVGHVRLEELDREVARECEQRMKVAEKEAERALRQERQAAEAEAQERRDEIYAEIASVIEDAGEEAELAQKRAEELVADARAKLAEAKRLADETAEEARLAAEEAQRLSDQAEDSTTEVDERVGLAEELRERTARTARGSHQATRRAGVNGRLDAYTKAELLDLASAAGIKGRSAMSKDQLVAALRNKPRSRT